MIFLSQLGDLECLFPFEGNGNPMLFEIGMGGDPTWNAFSRLKGMETSSLIAESKVFGILECLFPFEGNGNNVSVADVMNRAGVSWNAFSRLKGMET